MLFPALRAFVAFARSLLLQTVNGEHPLGVSRYSAMSKSGLPVENVTSRIALLRGRKVMQDADLAELYGIRTGVLIQAVTRNRARFPVDFMFQLTEQEVADLKSQIVTSSLQRPGKWGGRRKPLHAFTEQGVAMLSSVLRSERAIATNIAIMRAFVRLRTMVAANAELAKKLDELERRVSGHDEAIARIVRAIRELSAPPDPGPKRRIGFVS
jgi:tetrahydromethanopterin S-methyltransferase subunit G